MTIQINAASRLAAVGQLVTSGTEARNIKAFMRRKGYQFIGSGSDGSTWTKDNKVVLKIMYEQYSKPYLGFVEYSRMFPSLHAPKFYDTRTISVAELGLPLIPKYSTLVSVAVERLYPLPANYQIPPKEQESYNEYEAGLYAYARQHGFAMDLSTPGNILYRPKGKVKLVVADPFTRRW